MHPPPVSPRWCRVLYVISLVATFSGLAITANITGVAAKSLAFPSPSKQRQLFRQWQGNQGSNLINENPGLAEALGSSQYSTGAPAAKVSYGRSAYYKLSVKSAPESFLAVSNVTTTIASWPKRQLLCP
jgi:hypothetical protein